MYVVQYLAVCFQLSSSFAIKPSNRGKNTLLQDYRKCAGQCSCMSNLKYVHCEGINSQSFPNIPSDVTSIHIDHSELAYVHAGQFYNAHNVVTLQLSRSKLNSVELEAFRNLPLRELNLQGNAIQKLAANSVAREKGILNTRSFTNDSLRKLDVSGNAIDYVETGSFQHLKLLEHANFSHNLLGEVSPAFGDLLGIKELDVSFNKIEVLSANAFRLAFLLETLDLSDNRITCLLSYTFYSTLSLRQLYLQNNLISKLNSRAFFKTNNLELLNLNNNELTQILQIYFPIGFAKLTVLLMAHNKVLTIEDRSFKNMAALEELSLDDNKIHAITRYTLTGLASLRILNLQNNYIQEIAAETFTETPTLEYIYMDNNQIEHIHKYAFVNLWQLKIVRLTGNKLKIPLKEWFMKPKYFYLSQNELSSENNLVARNLSFHLSENDWQCDCKAIGFRQWAASKPDVKSIICQNPYYVKGSNLLTLSSVKFSCNNTVIVLLWLQFLFTSFYFISFVFIVCFLFKYFLPKREVRDLFYSKVR